MNESALAAYAMVSICETMNKYNINVYIDDIFLPVPMMTTKPSLVHNNKRKGKKYNH